MTPITFKFIFLCLLLIGSSIGGENPTLLDAFRTVPSFLKNSFINSLKRKDWLDFNHKLYRSPINRAATREEEKVVKAALIHQAITDTIERQNDFFIQINQKIEENRQNPALHRHFSLIKGWYEEGMALANNFSEEERKLPYDRNYLFFGEEATNTKAFLPLLPIMDFNRTPDSLPYRLVNKLIENKGTLNSTLLEATLRELATNDNYPKEGLPAPYDLLLLATKAFDHLTYFESSALIDYFNFLPLSPSGAPQSPFPLPVSLLERWINLPEKYEVNLSFPANKDGRVIINNNYSRDNASN